MLLTDVQLVFWSHSEPFLGECSLPHWFSGHTGHGVGFFSPGVGLCCCWTTLFVVKLILPACWDPYTWQPCPVFSVLTVSTCFMSSTNHDGMCSCSLFSLFMKILRVFTLWLVSESTAYSWLLVTFWTAAEPGSPACCSSTSSPWFLRFSLKIYWRLPTALVKSDEMTSSASSSSS